MLFRGNFLTAVLRVSVFACVLGQIACTGTPGVATRPKGATARSVGRAPAVPSSRSDADAPPSTFSLLPKSLQANPVLDMTVFTEMTAEGRKRPPPTPGNPVYYVAQADGFHQLGAQVAGEKPPPPAHMDYFVRKALHDAGYRPVPSPEVRPSLMILYRWGSHNNMGEQMSSDFPDFADADTLERARLVGGKKLVSAMARVMEWGETMLDRDDTLDYLKAQAHESCYFVVLFAYDYDSMVRGQRRLCWRTNMTVNTSGVSIRETLRPLIASSARFLGREMADPAITTRRLHRREKIEIGPATVIGYTEGPLAPEAETQKPKTEENPAAK